MDTQTNEPESMPVGFLGLGIMGQPMAVRLAQAGTPLIVWNRSPARCRALAEIGARVAADPAEVFDAARTVLMMLADADAIDTVLDRGSARFHDLVAGHLIVHMGTTSPEYSRDLASAIREAGGAYAEAPVSGSRGPAASGELVAMLAGEPTDAAVIEPLLAPMCRETVHCGPVPNGLLMKLAVNVYLIAKVTGLAEAVHFAERQALDVHLLRSVLDAGPMASTVSRTKTAKLVSADMHVQAAVPDVLKNARLIVDAAHGVRAVVPLSEECRRLYDETLALGHAADDMVAVIHALRERARSLDIVKSRRPSPSFS